MVQDDLKIECSKNVALSSIEQIYP